MVNQFDTISAESEIARLAQVGSNEPTIENQNEESESKNYGNSTI